MQTFKRPLTHEEEAHYIALCRDGDRLARDILIEYNLRLVAHIVKKYQAPGRCNDDLISIGTIGLIKAIDSYDSSKGIRLVTYAARCIDNEILMRLRQERKEQREISLYEPIGTDKEGNEISLMDIISSDDEQILNRLILSDNIRYLSKIFFTTLSPREQKVLTLRYGLFGCEELTQKDVAALLNISRSYVSRIEKKAIEKLRAHM